MKRYYLLIIVVAILLAMLSCATQLKNTDTKTYSNDNMVVIPAGWFIMGSHSGEFNESPEHEAFIDTFKIDRYEVSAKDFAGFLNAKGNPDNKYFSSDDSSTLTGILYEGGKEIQTTKSPEKYVPRKGFENFPANNVSWHGAHEYCKWKGNRLPTEAEWEKAARGTDKKEYPWGNNPPDTSKARFKRNLAQHGFNVMVPVDSLPDGISQYGLYNMSGNVWEWVSDWYRQNYCDFCDPNGTDYVETVAEIIGADKNVKKENMKNPDAPPKHNPRGPVLGSFKVLRGGSWKDKSELVIRTSYRHWLEPIERYNNTGFRCAY